MTPRRKTMMPWTAPILGLIVVQAGCTVLFLTDAVHDLWPLHRGSLTDAESLAELAAALGLALGLVFEITVLTRLQRAQARLQHSLSLAAGALSDVMAGYFNRWELTATERDVAAFTIKGFSISEIAGLRGSAEGTIKTHLNAIYRKSGVSGRAQLISVLIEDLFQAPPLMPEDRAKVPVGEGR